MDDRQRRQLKQCELAMLQAFKEVCEQLDLKYYLVEGTLLGAVRHQGFIPWDDDIDVAMPRGDYERFLREAPTFLPAHYFVQSLDSEPAYHANFAKIRDCRTTFIESSVKARPINHGVYIDIFPLDYVPRHALARRIVRKANQFCEIRIAQVFTLPLQSQHKPALMRCIRGAIGKLGARLLFPTLRRAVIVQKSLYMACRQSDRYVNYCSTWRERESMPVAWYGEGVLLSFEGIPMRVPSEYDKWLTQVYGNYMTPPPVEQRVGHHYAEVIDLERPYTAYVRKQHGNTEE